MKQMVSSLRGNDEGVSDWINHFAVTLICRETIWLWEMMNFHGQNKCIIHLDDIPFAM